MADHEATGHYQVAVRASAHEPGRFTWVVSNEAPGQEHTHFSTGAYASIEEAYQAGRQVAIELNDKLRFSK